MLTYDELKAALNIYVTATEYRGYQTLAGNLNSMLPGNVTEGFDLVEELSKVERNLRYALLYQIGTSEQAVDFWREEVEAVGAMYTNEKNKVTRMTIDNIKRKVAAGLQLTENEAEMTKKMISGYKFEMSDFE